MSDIELADLLGIDLHQAGALVLLSLDVDRDDALRRYGYPKDNAIPISLLARMQQASYVGALLEAARDDDDIAPATLARLRAHLAHVQSQGSGR